MRRAGKLAVLIGMGTALLAPTAAGATTRVVNMGPPQSAQDALQKLGADANDFFPHGVTIAVGDSIRFRPAAFHTVDLPKRGGGRMPLFTPTGQPVTGATDAAGVPFWFNGQPQVALNPALLRSRFGKRAKYTGARAVESGLPPAGNAKPFTVRFARAGRFRYFCDVHPGMSGVVTVRRRGARTPSAARVAAAVRAQVARARRSAARAARVKPPAGTVDVGSAGKGGVEVFRMFPATLTVPAGTTVRFQMSRGTFEAHTATFGPGDPQKQPQSYLGMLARSFSSPMPDPRAVYPSEPPATPGLVSPVSHGNGFSNTGVMDASSASPQPSSRAMTFTVPGTYDYYCLIHPFMHGRVVVR